MSYLLKLKELNDITLEIKNKSLQNDLIFLF